MHSCKVQLLAPLVKKRPRKLFPRPYEMWELTLALYVQDSSLTYMLTYMCRPDFPFHVLGGRQRTKKEGNQITLPPMCFSIPTSVRNSENSSRSCVLAWGLKGRIWKIDLAHVWLGRNAILGRGNGEWEGKEVLVGCCLWTVSEMTLVKVIIVKGKTWPRKLTLKLCISSPKLLP